MIVQVNILVGIVQEETVIIRLFVLNSATME